MPSLDRFLRRFIPSTAQVSRFPPIKWLGRLNDAWLRLVFPETADLPPNHLRLRVGVRNRIFFNHILCFRSGYNFWLYCFAKGLCRLDSQIVEIGCGYGRKPAHLRNFTLAGERFTGRYVGIDIDPELLDYARSHFPPERFEFLQTTQGSRTYAGTSPEKGQTYSFPLPDCSQDFVFSTSLFTHLLVEQLENYLSESIRVLKPGGSIFMNYFCYDHMAQQGALSGRWTFAHQIGPARVESLRSPEAAVAYTRDFLETLCREVGFADVTTLCDEAMIQCHLVGRKPI
jgi:SAM-dependent methyltransferase